MDRYEELIRTLKGECTALEQRCKAQDDMLRIQEKQIQVQEDLIRDLKKDNHELLIKGKEMARECDLLKKICKKQEEILNTIFGDIEKKR